MKRKTTEEFIEEASKVHNNLYDYSETVYVGSHTKVTVIDPIYGKFQVTPCNHIRKKSGHPERSFSKNRSTTEEYINKVRKVHNDLYDYSKVDYRGSKSKIIIIDPIHGEFTQRAGNHLAGQGQPKRRDDTLRLTLEQFIEKSKKFHGDLYDYSKVEYKNTYTNVRIIDPEYGEFKITPQYHMAGGGHPSRAYEHEYEVDHIIPMAFVCKSSERSSHKDNKLYQLLDLDINKNKVQRINNRLKCDQFILFGEKLYARNFRNDIEMVRYLFLRDHNIKVKI